MPRPDDFGLVEKSGIDNDTSNPIRINVGSGSSIFEVTVTLGTDMPWDSD